MTDENRLMDNNQFRDFENKCSEVIKKLDEEYDAKVLKLREDFTRVMEYDSDQGSNIEMEMIKCHSALARFSSILVKEKHAYNVVKNKYDRYYAQEMDNARMNPKLYRTTTELDNVVIRSSGIVKAKTYIDSYKEYIDYLTECIDHVKTKSYGLRIILESRKLNLTA